LWRCTALSAWSQREGGTIDVISSNGSSIDPGDRRAASDPSAPRQRWPVRAILLGGLPLLALLVLYVLDFHFDVRNRDGYSWMDPEQYGHFAVAVATGAKAFNTFELPSIFPLLLVPLLTITGDSVPATLWGQIPFVLALVIGTGLLRRRVGVTTPTFVVAGIVLMSPLYLGLSRSLYAELALSAVVTLQMLLWWVSDHFRRRGITVAFGAMFALGVMTKMTYPLFFIGPFVVEAAWMVRRREKRGLARLVGAFAVPAVIVVMVQYLVFPTGTEYYTSLGNTRIPIMRLIGPVDVLSWESATFYFTHLVKTVFVYLSPSLLLIPPVFFARRNAPSYTAFMLLAWFLVPMLVLILQPVKEPRHVAPCVLPGVLLVFRGLQMLRGYPLRQAITAVLFVGAVGQHALVATHRFEAPYFLDRPLERKQIIELVVNRDPRMRTYFVGGKFELRRWLYNKNFAIAGFRPNEALGLIWAFQPAVTFDLDLFDDPPIRWNDTGYDRFEDLFILASFSEYNRRCKWYHGYSTLTRDQVLSYADLLIVRTVPGRPVPDYAQRFVKLGEIPIEQGTILILGAPTPSAESFRALYATSFLERNAGRLGTEELNTVFFELLAGVVLDDRSTPIEAYQARFPAGFRPGLERRNIYWFGAYSHLLAEPNRRFLEIAGAG
jgi:hypothetical protein